METGACAVTLFVLVVVVFRVCTHETLSVDELTQFLGAFLFSSGMLLAEHNKNASILSNEFVNEVIKLAILVALLLWTKNTQIHGPKVNLADTIDLNGKVVLITGGNSGELAVVAVVKLTPAMIQELAWKPLGFASFAAPLLSWPAETLN